MKIVVSSISFSKNKKLVEELKLIFPNSIINIKGIRYEGEYLVDYFKDADAVILGVEKVNEKLLQSLPKLKFISKYGVGLDNIDLDACKRNNVQIGWTGGVNKRSVAEMTLGFMLMLVRNLYITSNQLKFDSVWNKNGGFQLTNKTIGIIGLGYIGKELVRLLKNFNCRIIANDIKDVSFFANKNKIELVDKKTIFKTSDIISIHTPLTNKTKNMFDMQVFSQMKKESFLINTARGGIIDETALETALNQKFIAGAALDVYEEEPANKKSLLKLKNLICTPHTAGNSKEAVISMGMSAISHLVNFKNH
jgi:phosphoglycerate dehydrogenase-like enzyme